jgi:hypothetical protein
MNLLLKELKEAIKEVTKEKEKQSYAHHDTMFIRVILNIEHTPYNINFITALREDGIKHKMGFSNKMLFYPFKLFWNKYKIINEIQSLTEKKVIIVTEFKNRNKENKQIKTDIHAN